jgi:hypothetical protein
VKDREEPKPFITGRGAAVNTKNRFEKIEVEPELEEFDPEKPETIYLKDASRSILVRNNSPDVGFDASINPYGGALMDAFIATRARRMNTSGSPRALTSRAGSS